MNILSYLPSIFPIIKLKTFRFSKSTVFFILKYLHFHFFSPYKYKNVDDKNNVKSFTFSQLDIIAVTILYQIDFFKRMKPVLKTFPDNCIMGKRGAAKINFTAKSPEDQFKFRITIYSNGSSSIDVDMQNRESISFSGDLILPE